MQDHIKFIDQDETLLFLDQRHLPARADFFPCKKLSEAIFAIKDMVVRGAPAIGIGAAWASVLAACELRNELGADAPLNHWQSRLEGMLQRLVLARPTAVNLAWAVQRMTKAWKKSGADRLDTLISLWKKEAAAMQAADVEANKRMGSYGAELIESGDTILTHCNAGALATAGYGTALGVIRAAFEQGKKIKVIADETRPLLQGARLTAYELKESGIPVTVACDNAAGLLMRQGMVQKVITGADRIAANGDTAKKIGTYGLAVLAKAHNIPFYIAAPLSTIDPATPNGEHISIEVRSTSEVTSLNATQLAPEGVPAFNFAFDVTPAELITAIITEKGILYPPYTKSIADLFE